MISAIQSPTIYEERHRRPHPGFWVVGLPLAVFGWWLFVSQIVLERSPVGDAPGCGTTLVVFLWVLFGLLLPAFLVSATLSVEVRDDAVRVRLFPIWGRTVPLDSIVDCQARTYKPLGEYGGWGIRFALDGRGWAYTLRGNRGVQLKLADKRPLLIGSPTPERLAEAINAARERRTGESGE
ncbi:MAG: DUF6141 family protein [Phycisphaerae bacterium]|jgi:hypothetical protein